MQVIEYGLLKPGRIEFPYLLFNVALGLKILLQALTFAVAILAVVLDYWRPDRRTTINRRLRKAIIGTAITLLLVSIGVTVYDEISSNRKEQKLNQQLQNLTEQNVTVTKQNESLRNEVAALSGTITSQESFCYVIAGVVKRQVFFILWTERNNPVYDVNVYFLDNSAKNDIPILQPTTKSHFIGTAGYLPRVVHRITLPSKVTRKRFSIILDTRYYTFVEDLRLVKSQGEWSFAFQVADGTEQLKSLYDLFMRDKGDFLDLLFGESKYKVLKEYFSEDFPRDEIEKRPFGFVK
jgi:hypothetical protein